MESLRTGQPWGKLVKLNSNETVPLFSNECTVGRKKGCYLSFPANKLVSGEHCKIVKDECSGQVWLQDTSTNGTVLNLSKLVKRQSHILHSGDIVYFVYRKNEPEHNIAYIYYNLQEEQHLSQSKALSKWPAQNPSAEPASDLFLSVEPVMLPKAPLYDVQEDPQPSTSASHFCMESTSVHPTMSGQDENASPAQEVEEDMQEPSKKRRKTNMEEGEYLRSPHTPSVKAVATERENVRSIALNPPMAAANVDKMEESLTCVICQDLLHDCISLQPCMHVFCAACYSGWMERSSLCPTCRCPVQRICKNHVLNNLVEAFLLQHPEKCRSEDDLKKMDKSNKIKQDMLQPKVDQSFSDEEGSSDYLFEISDNDNDSDSSDLSQPLTMCRQCPEYRGPVNQSATSSNVWLSSFPAPVPKCPPTKAAAEKGAAKLPEEQPSTSSDVSSVQVPAADQEYRCPPQSCHLICTCCLQPMPDRRMDSNNQQVIVQH